MNNSPPKIIYLQWNTEDLSSIHDGITWCEDKINDNDVAYIRLIDAIAGEMYGEVAAEKTIEGTGKPGGFEGIADLVKRSPKDGVIGELKKPSHPIDLADVPSQFVDKINLVKKSSK